jgi:hypothetical protein
MTRILGITCCLMVAVQVCGQTQEATESALERSRAMVAHLMTTVRDVMMKHLAAGGPLQAISACADTAQVLTAKISAEHDASIRRVSEKWRNPKDMPDQYEANVLAVFAAGLAAGAEPESIEHIEFIPSGSGTLVRYMKPIIVQGMCLTCHGDTGSMKPEVSSLLKQKYPHDKATGYKVGDLRGAVSVTLTGD